MSADPLLDVAELLRDRLDPGELRRVTTTLLALRLMERRHGVPAWSTVLELGERALRPAMLSLAEANPGLIPRPLPTLPHERLLAVLEALARVAPADGSDLLGDAFTRLLGLLARSEGQRGGQFYTPTELARLLVDLVPVEARVVYDPCCGSGGLLIAAGQHGAARLLGQEVNPSTWRLARWNALVHDLPIDVGAQADDTLRHDVHPGLQADAILANPPFNLARWGDDNLLADPRFAAVQPTLRNANHAWLLHVLSHLAPHGRAAVILASGSLSGQDPRERAVRASLVSEGHVHAILALPEQLFHNTVIGACVWVLGHDSPRVLFADLRAMGRWKDRSTRVLDAADRARIADLMRRHEQGEPIDEPGLARSVPVDEVSEDLTPGRWIPVGAVEGARLDLDACMDEVRRLAKQARRLDEDVEHAIEAWRRDEPEA